MNILEVWDCFMSAETHTQKSANYFKIFKSILISPYLKECQLK